MLGDLELVAVLFQVALDPAELRSRRVVPRTSLLELIGELLELTLNLLRLRTLRVNRGVGKRWDCRQEGETDPCENVRRPSLPTNDNPLAGGGTDAPGGAGTSRVEEASKPFGRTSTFSLLEPAGKPTDFYSLCRSSFREPVVRSRTVLGEAFKPRRRLLWFAALSLAVLAAPAISGASSTPSRSSLRAQNVQLAAKSRSAVLQLYSLDQRLGAAQSTLAGLSARTNQLRAERTQLEHQLVIAKGSSRRAQANLGIQLRAMYEQGNVEPLEVLFGAKNLDDALSSIENLNRASGQSQQALSQLKSARTQLQTTSRELATRQSALAAATEQALATARSLEQTRTARSSYLSSLTEQRSLNNAQIVRLVAQARAAQVRSEQLTANATTEASATPITFTSSVTSTPAPATPLPSAPILGGARTIAVTATGYALPGRTATGLPVGWGVVAVDPSVIPLGTHMTVPGYGEAVAADTGGAIVGSTIDLWFPTVAQANAWGRRVVTISLH